MCLRISSALGLLGVLAACGGETPPPPGTPVDCKLAGQEAFGADCTVEVSLAGGERLFVLWNPDGSFHRLRATNNERWLETADGADQARVERGEATLIVDVGGDAYILQQDLVVPRPGG